MKVLMVGVDEKRVGGMWTVAETFISNERFNNEVELYYVATSTGGSIMKRIIKMLGGYLKIWVILQTKEIDIVHVHMAEKGSVYRKGVVVWLAKVFKKKVVIQMHAGPILVWYSGLSNINKKIVKEIFNKADQIFVLGNYWKKQLSTIVNDRKMKVLYNGVQCPAQNPYDATGNYILYMGLLKKEKGVYDLIDAIKVIEKKLPLNYIVYLCGVDKSGETLDYIKRLNLQRRIVTPGWINKSQRLEVFKDTRICVLPSYFEALSMTVIESMSYGIPVVTTNISTMSELLGDEIALISPGDVKGLANQILKLIGDRELCKRISNIEHSRVQQLFDVDKIMQKVVCYYRNILQK